VDTCCHKPAPFFVIQRRNHASERTFAPVSERHDICGKNGRKPFLHAGPGQEAEIRALSVSLLAVAAIAASLLITRSHDEEAAPSAGEKQPVKQPLDAIRAAGL
jgi:hypothetical protein